MTRAITSASSRTMVSMEMSNSALMSTKLSMSGVVAPLSQLPIVLRDTQSARASSACDMPQASRHLRILSPMFIVCLLDTGTNQQARFL